MTDSKTQEALDHFLQFLKEHPGSEIHTSAQSATDFITQMNGALSEQDGELLFEGIRIRLSPLVPYGVWYAIDPERFKENDIACKKLMEHCARNDWVV